MEEEPKKGGRPRTGHRYHNRITAYLDDADLRLLNRMAEHLNGRGRRGIAATIREALREKAKREGVE